MYYTHNVLYGILIMYYTLGLLLCTILADFEKVDLAGIDFSDFAITCSIYSKMCDEFNIRGYNF